MQQPAKRKGRKPKCSKIESVESQPEQKSDVLQHQPKLATSVYIDVLDYALKSYDEMIAPNIFGTTSSKTALRRHILRRALHDRVSIWIASRTTSVISPYEVADVVSDTLDSLGLSLT